jgi:hypothetical protein
MASAAAAPAQATGEEAEMASQLDSYLVRAFTLPDDIKLDPALRAEADKIGAAHLARVRQLVPGWLQDERRLQTAAGAKPSSNDVFYTVWARLLNELALWQIEPGDAAYERATLEVLKTSPLVCRTGGDPLFGDFAGRINRLQAMPPARREATLATERELLQHWGKPRSAVQPWPEPLAQDAAMAAVAQVRAGGTRPPLALPPHLASSLLAQHKAYADLPWEQKCAVQQWWLRVSLAQGATPAAALNAFRYGTLISATDRLGRMFESGKRPAAGAEAPATPSYPKLAAYFDVTGVTRVSRRFDAAGKPVQASVIERKITVRGIRGTRPVAFENAFDAISVHYALKDGKPAGPKVFDMVWQLDPSDPKAAQPSQGESP